MTKLPYTQDISRTFDDVVAKEGASKRSFSAVLKDTHTAVAELRKHKENNSWPVLNVPERKDDIEIMEEAAKRITDHFSTLVVIGMGASSRCGEMLTALTKNPFLRTATGTQVCFIDNIDPVTSDQLLATLDLKNTMFLVISKSGDTAETLAHMLVLLQAVETRLGKESVHKYFMAIVGPGDNVLRRIAAARSIPMLEHDPDIGGRFAGLTSVGLLPAKVAGLDIRAVRQGAAAVTTHTFTAEVSEPARGAAIHFALFERGKTISVLMPYCDRLDAFGAWYQQIWAESLGKKGHGTTPLRSLGALDQHSQLQLYLDGPRDKFLTFILLAQADKGSLIPEPADAKLAYLRGHTIGDLMDAEQRATAETLTRNRCPVRLFTLSCLNEETLGALMMHFMLETMIMAELLQINAFDQPAVEESKRLTRTYLMKRK